MDPNALTREYLGTQLAVSTTFTAFVGAFGLHFGALQDTGTFKGLVDLAVIDVPWGRRLKTWTDHEVHELREFADYMMREGGALLLFTSWQQAMRFSDAFTQTKRLGGAGGAGSAGRRSTHSKYECQDAPLSFARTSSMVVGSPMCPDTFVSAWEMAIVLRRMKQNKGQAKFYLEREDRQLNLREAEARFGTKMRPGSDGKFISTAIAGVNPPRGQERLSWLAPTSNAGPVTKAVGKRRVKRMDCEKSPNMLAQMIVLLTKRTGSLVWDPAFGTGSTGNAALSVQRRFIGSELHPPRATAAIRRTLDR